MTDPATNLEEAIEATAERISIAWETGPGLPKSVNARTKEGARITWEHIYGTLRGRVPLPVPPDLMGVSVSAGLRICKGFVYTGTAFVPNGQFNEVADFRPWNGFMLPERIILNRYRQRTA